MSYIGLSMITVIHYSSCGKEYKLLCSYYCKDFFLFPVVCFYIGVMLWTLPNLSFSFANRLLHIKENHEFQKIRVSGKIHHIASARLIVHLNSPRSFKKAAAPISVSICNTVSPGLISSKHQHVVYCYSCTVLTSLNPWWTEPSSSLPLPWSSSRGPHRRGMPSSRRIRPMASGIYHLCW